MHRDAKRQAGAARRHCYRAIKVLGQESIQRYALADGCQRAARSNSPQAMTMDVRLSSGLRHELPRQPAGSHALLVWLTAGKSMVAGEWCDDSFTRPVYASGDLGKRA